MLGHEAEQFGREIVLEERLAGVARKPGFIEVKQSEMKSSPVQLGSVTWSVIKHPVEGRAIEGGREVCRTRLREELDVRGAEEPADTRGAESASEEKLVDCERLRTESIEELKTSLIDNLFDPLLDVLGRQAGVISEAKDFESSENLE